MFTAFIQDPNITMRFGFFILNDAVQLADFERSLVAFVV